jgi:hypothetical protein
MPVIKILSNAAAKGRCPKLLALSLLTLIWRLSDLFEEVITGTPGMSIGTWLITGGDALVTQIVIIVVLACTVFICYCHMRQEHTPEPNKT